MALMINDYSCDIRVKGSHMAFCLKSESTVAYFCVIALQECKETGEVGSIYSHYKVNDNRKKLVLWTFHNIKQKYKQITSVMLS